MLSKFKFTVVLPIPNLLIWNLYVIVKLTLPFVLVVLAFVTSKKFKPWLALGTVLVKDVVPPVLLEKFIALGVLNVVPFSAVAVIVIEL